MTLEGKTALVTGASKGIGQGIAIRLGELGCSVVVNYNSDQAGAEQTVDAIRKAGGEAIASRASVANATDVDQMFDDAVAEFGKVDIVVNNAGTQVWAPFLELAEEDWDRVIDTNLKGNFLCTQRAGRLMKDSGGGRIVNIGSGCNKVAFPNLVSYTASKGGIEQLTKVAAAELGQYGITVNCVAPGAILIERTKHEADDYAGKWSRLTPMNRIGHPADVAATVAFLCADEAEFITGQTILVDGGLFTQGPWAY